ncbi:hypothetical protein BU24DRAFT_472713 [Aaosphaeria arxii CBS 175.79]|uniref:Uncharacterized protein n=1 Tax=Aaosphaeria arxii CBS 175.79 TaxID=1450172 RepID=A0A6A5XCM6_9PLEO|nr:uncharacterized protein BU24DRAFT_472713 [Aaosphaeria arxii CBS 175.79]KAF2010557.1 hypothetical protein BU24DRAFT_472713 [Aaosphaeria arxii CBS 175.79]
MSKECTSTEFPKDRLNIEGFHDSDTTSQGTIRPKRAHVLKKDIRNFDAQFFGIPPVETACLDPQQRGLLETTYHAIENACSSGLVALDLACQEIWSGRSSIAICAGSSIIFSPENLITLSNMSFLSPDGKCFSFDHRGNGYAKGEGFASLILKPISKALDNGDTIRSLIRSIGSNQDGHTAGGIIQPSRDAQKHMIAETYHLAGLDLSQTRLFEAHGTGTAVGDPVEAARVSETFRRFRSHAEPLFVGAVKSNFGHLEGVSGLFGVINRMLSIERGVIPPNTNFEKLNSNIDDSFFHLKFPNEPAPWLDAASGIRRASVIVWVWRDERAYTPRLFVFSAFDEVGIQRQLSVHQEALAQCGDYVLDDYAYALACRRDVHTWKAFCLVTPSPDIQEKPPLILSTKPCRSSQMDPTLCFIFTGQGAQWHGMGRQLLGCSPFRNSFIRSQHELERLGWTTSLINILDDANFAQLLDRAQYSQITTTCVQIALIDVFRWLRLSPSIVLGHSSGEIAAAYCAGYLDHSSAMRVSYYRGLLSSSLEDDARSSHSMAAVGLSVEDTQAEIAKFEKTQQSGPTQCFTISCINSPNSVTVAGPLDALKDFTKYLVANGTFARLLKVKVGYHSPQMCCIASEYAELMGVLRPDPSSTKVTMVSSVTGSIIDQHVVCHAAYWVRNMISRVNFLAAIQICYQKKRTKDMKNLNGSHAENIRANVWLEIGPHSALQGPLKQSLHGMEPQAPVNYTSAMVRNVSALSSLLTAIGSLWQQNVNIDMQRGVSLSTCDSYIPVVPPSLPAYVFNHSVMYWEEPRSNIDFRLREHHHHDLVGARFGDLRSKAEAQWRLRITVKSMPWVQDHKVQGSLVYPAAGSIAMAIEGMKQLLASSKLLALEFKDIEFPAPIRLSPNHSTQVRLHLSARRPNQPTDFQYNFRIFPSTSEADHELYESMSKIGLDYGPAFQTLAEISSGSQEHAIATCLPLPAEVLRSRPSEFTVHPSRLDGLFQLSFAATAGVNDIRGMVPTRIKQLNIPVAGFGHNEDTKEIAHCQVTDTTDRTAIFSTTVFDEATLGLKAKVEGLELTALSGPSKERKCLGDAPSVCHQVEWKPDLALMSDDEVYAHCQLLDSGLDDLEWVRVLHSLTQSYVNVALDTMCIRQETCGSTALSARMTDYAQWLSTKVDNCARIDSSKLDDMIAALPFNPVINTFVVIGQNLPAILSGDMHVDEFLPKEWDIIKLVRVLDTEIGNSKNPLGTYIDCLTHKNPNLQFYEIGIRLGSICTFISDREADSVTSECYGGYTIVDVDEPLLEYMQKQLPEHMNFKAVDGSKSPSAQGFNPQTFDIITLNATTHDQSYSADFIESITTLLKPNGKLIVREAPNTSLLWGFMLGLSSRSFLGEHHAPSFADSLLSHFSLCQTQPSDITPHWNVTVYYKDIIDTREMVPNGLIIVTHQDSVLQRAIGTALYETIGTSNTSRMLSLSDAAELPDKNFHDFIITMEMEQPLLSSIDRQQFAAIKEILHHAKSVMWVKRAGEIPDYSLSEGLLRVCHEENERISFVSLGIELKDKSASGIALRIHTVYNETQQRLAIFKDEYESEYRERNGCLLIPRIVEAREYDKHIFSSIEKPLAVQRIGDKNLRLTCRTAGALDALEFVSDELEKSVLLEDQVEIEVRAIGVNFKDLMGLLGRVSAKNPGSEFAGVITAVGDSTRGFRPGNRIVAAYVDAYKTRARVPWQTVYHIPDDMPFEAAASIPTTFRTAYFCLQDLAHLKSRESILIHRASGGTGQAAIQLAQMIGATIYVTVGSEAKKKLIMERYGIAERHILQSRNKSFYNAIKDLTEGRGVDVVLNSLSGELLEASWDCVAPFGRFIEIGLGDAYTRQQLPMFNFSKGISYISFNLTNFMTPEFFPMHTPLMKSVWDLVLERKIRPPYPLQVYSIAHMEEAFRFLNSGESSGKIVIRMDRTAAVPTITSYTPAFRFDPDSTYVVTGGLGGIGLKIAQWLSGRGAMSLILISRSGLSPSSKAWGVISALRSNGTRVDCPAMDITDKSAMERYFKNRHNTMPPIKGCIQSAMVLRDATLANMTVEDWHQALAPKVKGTWNLHELLPPMDFFILLSSFVGVGGNRGQANYAAGNTFEDEFARWRTTEHHTKTVSLDLGFVVDAGVTAENDALVRQFLRRQVDRPNYLEEIFSLFDHICDPNTLITTEKQSQIITGMQLPSAAILEIGEVPAEYMIPMFRISHKIQTASTAFPTGAQRQSLRVLLTSATSSEEVGTVLSSALQAKLAHILGLRTEDVDVNRPLNQYGMDSLVAIEFQSWIRREVDAEIAIFEVLGESTVDSLSRVLMTNSRFAPKSTS